MAYDNTDDYSQFDPTGGGRSQDLPTGQPGSEVIPGGSWDALRTSSQALPTGNPYEQEGQLPVANRGSVAPQGGGTGELSNQEHTAPIAAVLAYLHGDGAADQQTVEQLEQQIDPQGQMDDGERHLRAIQAAHQQGGPGAAWSFVQANRQAYNAKMAFAKSALQGVQGKPPDINAASQAATDAYSHVPDGKTISFHPSQTMQGGVTATVMPTDGQPQSQDLSPEQFASMLDVGKDGLYDKVYQSGFPTLDGSGFTNARAPAKQTGNAPYSAPGSVSKPTVFTGEPGSTPVGADPSRGRSETFGGEQDTGYDRDLLARANNLWPGLGNNRQRSAWLAKMQEARDAAEAEHGNKTNVENIKAQAQRDIWGTRAGATVASSQNRKEGQIGAASVRGQSSMAIAQLQQEARTGNAEAATAVKMVNGWQVANPGQEVPDAVIQRAKEMAQNKRQPAGGGAAPQQGVVQKTLKDGTKVNVRQVAPGKWQVVQ